MGRSCSADDPNFEDCALVDRDANGRAVRVAEIGWFYETGKKHPLDDAKWPDLDPSTATLWGIITASCGLAVLAFVWWWPL